LRNNEGFEGARVQRGVGEKPIRKNGCCGELENCKYGRKHINSV